MRLRALLPALALGGALGACAEAGGGVSGGERRFDAAAPTPVVEEDAATPEPVPCAPADRGTGHTFTELYADYFGREGGAACAGDGRCHGAADQPGAVISDFVCPVGDQDACYRGVRAALVRPQDRDLPEESRLYFVLRKEEGDGYMPLRPECFFDETDMTRIRDWIRAGAPND